MPLFDVVDQVRDGIPDGLTVEVTQLVPALALQLRYPAQGRFQFTLQVLDVALDALLLFGVELLELVGAERLAFLHRRERNAHRRAHHRDSLFPGTSLHAFEAFLVALPHLLLNGLPAGAVFLTLEHGRDRRTQLLHQALHIVAQYPATTRGQTQRVRAVRRLEVVHVNPVGRRRLVGSPVFEKATHHGVLADARRPEREQVVALLPDADAEADRLDRPVLTDDILERLEIVRGLECELGRIRQTGERFDGQGGQRRHWQYLDTCFDARRTSSCARLLE
jgi:hypothetical protein